MARNPYEYSYILRRKLEKRILKILLLIFILFLLTTLFFRFILFPVVVKSDSMEPNLKTNSFVFVTPLVKSSDRVLGSLSLERGMIVLVEPQFVAHKSIPVFLADSFISFFTFQQYFPFQTNSRITGTSCVRRLVALPGDTIYMDNYILYIKPQNQTHFLTEFEIIDNTYDVSIDSQPDTINSVGFMGKFDEIVLGENEYFLLCDNRTDGIDSRVWGPVGDYRIDGKILLCYFPFSRFKQY